MQITFMKSDIAPELSYILLNNVEYKPVCLKGFAVDWYALWLSKNPVKLIRSMFFKPFISKGMHFKVLFYYDLPEFRGMNKSFSGLSDNSALIQMKKSYMSLNCGATLLNGDYLPPVKFKVESFNVVGA